MWALLLLVGCDEIMGPGPGVPGTAPPAWYEDEVEPFEAGADREVAVTADQLVASLVGAEGHEDVRGQVRFESVPDGGVRVVAEVAGLEPGKHGLYVHQGRDCASPGPHLDFGHDPRGDIDPITGNAGGLDADEGGAATLRTILPEIDLSRVLDRAVVVLDDAGNRVACGVISEEEG